MNDTLWVPDDGEIGGEDTLVAKEYSPESTAPSVAIVEAIASIEDVCPIALSTSGRMTLSDSVDPDALDRLLTGRTADSITITFSIDEYTVWIGRTNLAVGHTTTEPE